nr:hypothetical protein [Tanacetum cinerariifolium]
DFEEINGGYVAFGGNLKGGKITGKGIQENLDAGQVGKKTTSTQHYVLLPLCPSDTDVSPNFRIARKSSFVDPSNYPNDPDMPELEDIVYLDDEEDVGAEADLP